MNIHFGVDCPRKPPLSERQNDPSRHPLGSPTLCSSTNNRLPKIAPYTQRVVLSTEK